MVTYYEKSLFYWDFTRTIFFLLLIVIFAKPPTDWTWFIYVPMSEFISNDGHIWGDIAWISTGYAIDIRGIIWLVSAPAIVVLDFFWVFRKSNVAKVARTLNWVIALIAYFTLTVFNPTNPNYDYAVWYGVYVYFGYSWWIIPIALFSIAVMWLGVIIITGYLLHKIWLNENRKIGDTIIILLSLGAPGSGQIIAGRKKRGIIFLLIAPLVLFIGLFLFYIPTLIYWLFAAYDTNKLTKKQIS